MLKGDTVDLNVKHHFSEGLYARELFIPALTDIEEIEKALLEPEDI